MADKDRLMRALFGHEEREHRNIKFLRGTAEVITPDQLREEAANGLEEIVLGLVDAEQPSQTVDRGYKERELSEILASL